MFGVFYYRSGNPKTLAVLEQFLPVPTAPLLGEFAAGATPQEVCARTIRGLRSIGAQHVYISNLPLGRANRTLRDILELVDRN